MMRTICTWLLLVGTTTAQATFEAATTVCAPTTYPVGCGAAGGPEGISRNSNPTGFATADVTPNGAGMPCEGTRYGRVQAFGPAAPGGGNHMYIPIPPGANSVSFCWDFYDYHGGQSGFNDGMSIDVVGIGCTGPSLANLAYADDNGFVAGTGIDAGGCGNFQSELAPNGPQAVTNALLPVGAAFIRVAVWNGGNNIGPSTGAIDNVQFASCQLVFSSPNGPGSLQMDNAPCSAMANIDYFVGVTMGQGAFPNGWFFGLDATVPELVNEFTLGFPFVGTLDAIGASSFGPTTPFALPSGMQIWAVTSQWASGFGASLGARPPVTYPIP
jgi:hypothetical protein